MTYTYASLEELAGLDGMDEPGITDEILEAALVYSEETIDKYCGASFTVKPFKVTTRQSGHDGLNLDEIMWPRSITFASIAGEEVEEADRQHWELFDEGIVYGLGAVRSGYSRSIVIEGTAGYSDAPPQPIKWAMLTLARQHVLDQVSRIPDRALSIANEFGNISLAQAGGLWRPTSLPDVNAVLNRYRQRPPGAF